jgi:hypothetical protein
MRELADIDRQLSEAGKRLEQAESRHNEVTTPLKCSEPSGVGSPAAHGRNDQFNEFENTRNLSKCYYYNYFDILSYTRRHA